MGRAKLLDLVSLFALVKAFGPQTSNWLTRYAWLFSPVTRLTPSYFCSLPTLWNKKPTGEVPRKNLIGVNVGKTMLLSNGSLNWSVPAPLPAAGRPRRTLMVSWLRNEVGQMLTPPKPTIPKL